MLPDIGLLSATAINWESFRATIDKILKLRPDVDVNSLPINLSEDSKILLNIAAYYGWSLDNPLNVLRNIPPFFMEFLHYSFFIACDKVTWEEFNVSANISIMKRDIPDGLLIIATGTLAAWHNSILCNLSRDWRFKHETRVLFCKLMLFFEKERGLRFLFDNYKKKAQPDFTFLLEKK